MVDEEIVRLPVCPVGEFRPLVVVVIVLILGDGGGVDLLEHAHK